MKRAALVIDLLLVLGLAVGVTALNVHWAMLNQAPPASDDNSHLYNSLEVLANVSGTQRPLSLLLLYPGHYPPLAYQATFFFYCVLGVAPWVPIASFFPFLLILGMSMYGIGTGLGGRAVGLTCAVTSLCAPVVLDHSRTYFLDMPSTAMLALSICSLLYSRGFSQRRWSLVFGISMALGMLSKWTHPVFVLPLLAASMYPALRGMYADRWPGFVATLGISTVSLTAVLHILYGGTHDDLATFEQGPDFRWIGWFVAAAVCVALVAALRRAVRTRPHLSSFTNLVEAFIVSLLLAWPWYLFNGDKVREKIVYQANVPVDFGLGLEWYMHDIAVMAYLAPVLLAVGVMVGLARRPLRQWTLLLVASLALSTSFAALLPPDSRYVMPVIVFVLPLAFAWTSQLRAGAAGHALQAVVLLAASVVALWQATAFEWRRLGFEGLEGPRRTQATPNIGYLSLLPALPAPPVQGEYPYDEVLREVRKRDGGSFSFLGVIESGEDAGAFQPRSFVYRAALLGEKVFLVETSEALERGGEAHDLEQVKTFLVIYRFAQSRASLLREARARGWISPDAEAEKKYLFSPGFHVELFRAPARPAGT